MPDQKRQRRTFYLLGCERCGRFETPPQPSRPNIAAPATEPLSVSGERWTIWRCPNGHVENGPADPAVEHFECAECAYEGREGISWYRAVEVVPASTADTLAEAADAALDAQARYFKFEIDWAVYHDAQKRYRKAREALREGDSR